MDRFYRFSLACACVVSLLLYGCGSNRVDHLAAGYDNGPLTPLPDALLPQDPRDNMVDSAVQDYLKSVKAPLATRYDFTRIDLDNDGRREALVMMKGPHNYWCDANGCSLVVFKASNENFTFGSEIFPVRGPFYVSDKTSSGWRDLIIRVSGQSYARAKDVAMQYDGHQYPRNPFFQPGTQISQANLSQRLFP